MPLQACIKQLTGLCVVLLGVSACGTSTPVTRDAAPQAVRSQVTAPQDTRAQATTPATARPQAVAAPPQAAIEVTELDDNEQAQYRQAVSFLEAGDYLQAEAALQKIALVHPGVAGPYLNLGIIYARTNRLDAARESLMHVLRIKPESAIAYNQLGIVNRQSGKFQEARQAYEQAIRLSPDYSFAHLNLGVLLDIYLQNPGEALPHYQRYQELTPSEDTQVSGWIVDLQFRLKTQQKTASVVTR